MLISAAEVPDLAAPETALSPNASLRELIDAALRYSAVAGGIAYAAGLLRTIGGLFALHLPVNELDLNTAQLLVIGVMTVGGPVFCVLLVVILPTLFPDQPIVRRIFQFVLLFVLPLVFLAAYGRVALTTGAPFARSATVFLFTALLLMFWQSYRIPRQHSASLVLLTQAFLGIVLLYSVFSGYFEAIITNHEPPSTRVLLSGDAILAATSAGLELQGTGPLTKPVLLVYVTVNGYYFHLPDGRLVRLSKDKVIGIVRNSAAPMTTY